MVALFLPERWKGSTGTSLTNFAQQDYNGAKTSKLNLICCLQSHFRVRYNTATSFSTTTSRILQARHPTSRTTATATAPTSLALERLFLETFCNIPTQKLCLRNQHQKLRGIWLGRNLIANEHILALPLQYSARLSTTTGAYRLTSADR